MWSHTKRATWFISAGLSSTIISLLDDRLNGNMDMGGDLRNDNVVLKVK